MTFVTIAVLAAVVIFLGMAIYMASRYQRCPSDQILVLFGKVGEGQSAQCIHGGGKLVWPLIQDFSFLSLTPMSIDIPLEGALSQQNIRINVPSTFTVGISTVPTIMTNAAERLLGLNSAAIEGMVRDIILGQLRLVIATLSIEEINQDREKFLAAIRNNVEPELNKIGLYLINVNITDITDESGYIEAIGKKAAAEAVQQARVDVAEQEKVGAVGQSEADRGREIQVAQNLAEAEKGKKAAEADQRVYVQEQEATAIKGEKSAERDQRVFVNEQEAQAIMGENQSQGSIAEYNAGLQVKEAEAKRVGEVAQREADTEIQKAQAKLETERLTASEVVPQEIDKLKVEIAAEAAAEATRREAAGEADAILLKYTAEAEGVKKVLNAKAEGYKALVAAAGDDANAASTLLMIEQLPEIVDLQVEAIKGIKIDSITVWDSGGGEGGGSSTANFMKNLLGALPPLHEVAKQAGFELPESLGRLVGPPVVDVEAVADVDGTNGSTEAPHN